MNNKEVPLHITIFALIGMLGMVASFFFCIFSIYHQRFDQIIKYIIICVLMKFAVEYLLKPYDLKEVK